MQRCMTAIRRLVAILLAPALRFIPADPPRQVLHRALAYDLPLPLPGAPAPGPMRIAIELELRIFFRNDAPEPENEVGVEVEVAELDEAQEEPPEMAEVEADLPGVQDVVEGIAQGMPAAHAGLMGSLYGILGGP